MNGFESNSNYIERQRLEAVERLAEFEQEKGEFEIEIIKDADRRTTKVIERYGIPASSSAIEHIHIVSKSKWPPGISEGLTSRQVGVIVSAEENQDLFLLKVVHEMFHLKGINFLPVPLTEAIVERLTNEAVNFDDPSFEGAGKFSGIYTYDEYRRLLDKLIEKIIERVPQHKIDKVYVFTFFAKAHLSGSPSYLDFLDDIFGTGTLETLIQLSDNPEDLKDFILRL